MQRYLLLLGTKHSFLIETLFPKQLQFLCLPKNYLPSFGKHYNNFIAELY